LPELDQESLAADSNVVVVFGGPRVVPMALLLGGTGIEAELLFAERDELVAAVNGSSKPANGHEAVEAIGEAHGLRLSGDRRE
jgi:hypothetical protein